MDKTEFNVELTNEMVYHIFILIDSRSIYVLIGLISKSLYKLFKQHTYSLSGV